MSDQTVWLDTLKTDIKLKSFRSRINRLLVHRTHPHPSFNTAVDILLGLTSMMDASLRFALEICLMEYNISASV